MSQTYQARRRARKTAAEQKPHIAAPGPSLQELAAGAMPSQAQMGRRVDLPEAIREKMESSFGADFSGVRLYESQTVADAGAEAMTMGSSIAFAPGQLDLASTSGQALLGHELSHVVSQARGESAGRGFLADQGLEAQADRQGMLAAQGESAYAGPVTPISASAVPAAVGPFQAAGKSLDEADREQLALNDAAENKEGLVTSENLPSRFHFIKRRRALDQLRQQIAQRLAQGQPVPEELVESLESPPAEESQEPAPPPVQQEPTPPPVVEPVPLPESSFVAVNSQGEVTPSRRKKKQVKKRKKKAEDRAQRARQQLEEQSVDLTAPMGDGGDNLAYSAANIDGITAPVGEEKEELEANRTEAEGRADETRSQLVQEGIIPVDRSTFTVGEGGEGAHSLEEREQTRRAQEREERIIHLGLNNDNLEYAALEQNRAVLRDFRQQQGLPETGSLTGQFTSDAYLTAALPFRKEKDRLATLKTLQNRQKSPKDLAKMIRSDMKQFMRVDIKGLYSEDEETVLNTRANLLHQKALVDSIKQLILEEQEKKNSKLLNYIRKPGGEVFPAFVDKLEEFERAMGSARETGDAWANTTSPVPAGRERSMQRLETLRQSRGQARARAKEAKYYVRNFRG